MYTGLSVYSRTCYAICTCSVTIRMWRLSFIYSWYYLYRRSCETGKCIFIYRWVFCLLHYTNVGMNINNTFVLFFYFISSGCMYSMAAFGPVLGFLLGAYLLSFHMDSFSGKIISIGKKNICLNIFGLYVVFLFFYTCLHLYVMLIN